MLILFIILCFITTSLLIGVINYDCSRSSDGLFTIIDDIFYKIIEKNFLFYWLKAMIALAFLASLITSWVFLMVTLFPSK